MPPEPYYTASFNASSEIPTEIQVEVEGTDYLQVSWLAETPVSSSDETAVTYSAIATSDNGATESRCSPQPSSPLTCTISGLKPGTFYNVNVEVCDGTNQLTPRESCQKVAMLLGASTQPGGK